MFDLGDKCFVIAEAGTCHAGAGNRRADKAIAYVRAANFAGADAVKFQMFDRPSPETMFCWINGDEQRAERWHLSMMPLPAWRHIKAEADALGIVLLASVFETQTIEWIERLRLPATKVASRAARSFPYDQGPKPHLVSLGMAPNGAEAPDGTVFFECESRYPSKLRWGGDLPGFSDHSGTPWVAIDAIARGCKAVEVHFYIEPEDAGPDYPASLSLDELSLVCEARDAFAEMP